MQKKYQRSILWAEKAVVLLQRTPNLKGYRVCLCVGLSMDPLPLREADSKVMTSEDILIRNSNILHNKMSPFN